MKIELSAGISCLHVRYPRALHDTLVQIEIRRCRRMTQLLFQCFSQSIGRCVRFSRSVSYCRGAHWLSYLFLKFLERYISEKLERLSNPYCPEAGNQRTSNAATSRSRCRYRSALVNFVARKVWTKSHASSGPSMRPPRQMTCDRPAMKDDVSFSAYPTGIVHLAVRACQAAPAEGICTHEM